MTRYIWRISMHADLSGRGGLLGDGRWHRRGIPVVYCTDHPSTALLEILVHTDPEDVPDTLQLLKIACPADVPIYVASDTKSRMENLEYTQTLGSTVLRGGQYCLLDVPSVVMPLARNVLINPEHPASSGLRIEEKYEFPFDQRLARRG